MYVLQSLHNGWAQGSVQSGKAVQEGQWPKSAQWIAYSHANFFFFFQNWSVLQIWHWLLIYILTVFYVKMKWNEVLKVDSAEYEGCLVYFHFYFDFFNMLRFWGLKYVINCIILDLESLQSVLQIWLDYSSFSY